MCGIFALLNNANYDLVSKDIVNECTLGLLYLNGCNKACRGSSPHKAISYLSSAFKLGAKRKQCSGIVFSTYNINPYRVC